MLISLCSKAQIEKGILDIVKLNQSASLPKDILSSRSIVLISVPKGSSNTAWKKLAGEMQAYFAESGIDAVAYFSIEELVENIVAQKELAKSIFSRRRVVNLITLSVLSEESILFTVGPYNRKWTFFDENQSFWMRETNDLENIWSEMTTIFKSGGHKKENILVLDSPEFFDLSVPYKTRAERFTKVMESQKVAVPMYVSMEDDPNLILRFKADILNGSEDRGEANTKAMNDQLSSIIGQYPFETELVNINEKSEDGWLRSGYGFILYQARGTEKEIRKKLQYKPSTSNSTDFLNKFYLKQLRTQSVFFGRKWDAATTRFGALSNFINSVRTEFKSDN